MGILDIFNKTHRARKKYKRIIDGLGHGRKTGSSEQQDLVGKAYFELGKLDLSENEKASAFNNYKKASEFGHPLDEDAVVLMGNCYAKEENKNKEAIEIYLKYIKFRASPTLYQDSERVYSLLETICHIDEESIKSEQNLMSKKLELNANVVDVNSTIEWAHYYLGLGYFLNGDFNRSITHFKKAQKLFPNRAATHYYLGKIYLENGAIEKALSTFRESLRLDPNQAEVSFQVGKTLIDQLEVV